MKKLFALMLALCLLLCSAAMAETETAEETAGEMIALDKIGLQMYLFANLVEDTEYQPNDGSTLLYAWKDADPESQDYLRIEGMDMSSGGIATAEDFLAVAKTVDEDATLTTLESGLTVVVFNNANENEVCAALVGENGYVIGLSLGPVTDDEDTQGLGAVVAFGIILASLSPIE